MFLTEVRKPKVFLSVIFFHKPKHKAGVLLQNQRKRTNFRWKKEDWFPIFDLKGHYVLQFLRLFFFFRKKLKVCMCVSVYASMCDYVCASVCEYMWCACVYICVWCYKLCFLKDKRNHN